MAVSSRHSFLVYFYMVFLNYGEILFLCVLDCLVCFVGVETRLGLLRKAGGVSIIGQDQ